MWDTAARESVAQPVMARVCNAFDDSHTGHDPGMANLDEAWQLLQRQYTRWQKELRGGATDDVLHAATQRLLQDAQMCADAESIMPAEGGDVWRVSSPADQRTRGRRRGPCRPKQHVEVRWPSGS